MKSSGLVKEKPSNTSGSMAAMTVVSTGERRHGSLVNSGSKLPADFFPRCMECVDIKVCDK